MYCCFKKKNLEVDANCCRLRWDVLLGVQFLQKYGYVSTVNGDKLGDDSSTQIQQ